MSAYINLFTLPGVPLLPLYSLIDNNSYVLHSGCVVLKLPFSLIF